MEGIEHKTVSVNGLSMHIAEKGQGPLVLFVHGFPELWYSWRHQILYLAARGYRAVAPDLRGYGDTTGAPVDDVTKFSIFHLVGDLIALLDNIGAKDEKVFVVGQDWGAYVAWHLCMFRPDRVKALFAISVPFFPRNPSAGMVDLMRTVYGPDYYMCRFQEPGDIEEEFAKMDTRTLVKQMFLYREPGPFYFPKGKGFATHYPEGAPVTLPDWLTEEDVDYFAAKWEKAGVTGGINYYRTSHLNWEMTAAWAGAKVNVPAKFVIGELDLVYYMPGVKDYIHSDGFKNDVPLLEEVVVMEGAAHFLNQEKHEEIGKHVFEFFQKFS